MSKEKERKQGSIVSGKRAEDALAVGLDRYLESVGYTGTLLQHAGSTFV